MKTALEQRNELFTAYLGEYADKGFELREIEDGLELWRNNHRCDRFTWHASIQAVRNACRAWLIKEEDFGTDGIEFEAIK